MSHYAVAVFSDDGDFDKLLEPYNEQDEKYFEFQPVAYTKIVSDFKKFKYNNPEWSFDMYLQQFGYTQNENGEWGYRSNPHGYWDWYSLDGKDYLFELKDGAELHDGEWDFRKDDYDWYPVDENIERESEEFWDNNIADELNEKSAWNRDYFLERYKTREQYVKEMSRTVPYAFITPDGKWHSPGMVGWFACSDETAEDMNAYYKEWDAWIASECNPYVNLVDCHI